MNKPFGVQGEIINFPYKDFHELITPQDGVEFEITSSIFFVGVDDENKLEQAKELAYIYLFAWAERQDWKIHVDFNHSWRTNLEGIQDHFIEVQDTIRASDRVQIGKITHQISIPATVPLITQSMYDSASFINDSVMVQKILKYPVLQKAIQYYSQEVVDDKRPLYGIYKALEVIIEALRPQKAKKEIGERELVALANKPLSYLDDVMQTAQLVRHALTSAKRKIDDAECKRRAKSLIDAFAISLP